MGDVTCFMRKILKTYSDLRGKEREDFASPFWDAVVITASDSEQQEGFQLQLESKKRNRELPLVTYHVLADPPGNKIGSGGSTFEALSFLKTTYGDELSKMRVLLLHAGGYSQRLPSHSLCGKLFSCIPMDHEGLPWQMLDLKLAIFLPFLKRMSPGFYITASDDIVTYALDKKDWTFDAPGFTALAHPSSLLVGSTHGVYVMPKQASEKASCCWVSPCLSVLQKPSFEKMRSSGAVLESKDGKEYVYSDSSFYFDCAVAQLLLDAFPTLGPLSCESDVYGDFLQPLGTRPSQNYIYLPNNNNNQELSRVRQGLYDLLSGKPLNILVLEKSCFYHIGTTEELIFHWCKNDILAHEICLQKISFSLLKPSTDGKRVRGVIMQSVVHSDSVICENSVMEYCHFDVPVVSGNCVISNCRLSEGSCDSPLTIPDSVLFFTCSVSVSGQTKWSCGAMHFEDDVKRCYDTCHSGDIIFMGKKLCQIYSTFGVKESGSLFDATATSCSLWNAKLFSVFTTMEEAFLSTVEMVRGILERSSLSVSLSGHRLSMEEFVKKKSLKDMIDYREKLTMIISQSSHA